MRKNHTVVVSSLIVLLTVLIGVYIFVAFIWDRIETTETVTQFDENIELQAIEKKTKKSNATFVIPKTGASTLDDYFENLMTNTEETFRTELDQHADDTEATLTFETSVKQVYGTVYFIEINSKTKIDKDATEKQIYYTIDIKNDSFVTVEDLVKPDKIEAFLSTPNASGEAIEDNAYLKYVFNLNDYDLLIVNPDTGEIQEEVELIDLFDLINDKYQDIIFSGPLLSQGKPVSITFDDGPNPDVTSFILETLKTYDVHATFFNLVKNTQKYPELARQIVDGNHEIGNHGVTHRDLVTLPDSELEVEIIESKAIIKEITGETPELYRPAYGSIDARVKSVIQQSDQALAMWSIDTLDWQNNDPESILNYIKEHIQPGSIILVHDIQPATAKALPMILDFFEQEGYHQTTMSELIPYIENTYNEGYFGKE